MNPVAPVTSAVLFEPGFTYLRFVEQGLVRYCSVAHSALPLLRPRLHRTQPLSRGNLSSQTCRCGRRISPKIVLVHALIELAYPVSISPIGRQVSPC
jgi:hypothetical protein